MVLLSQESKIDAQKYPLAYKWDVAVRRNHAMYQREIDKLSYHLQRVQRYIFSVQYPFMHQSSVIRLSLIKRKQMIGAVTNEELNQYKQLDCGIESYFKRTFNVAPYFTKASLIFAGTLFVGATLFNLSIAHRLYTLVMPPVLSYVMNLNDAKADHHTSQFLDWVLEKRKAECEIEKVRHLLPKNKGKLNVNDVYGQYVKLVHGE